MRDCVLLLLLLRVCVSIDMVGHHILGISLIEVWVGVGVGDFWKTNNYFFSSFFLLILFSKNLNYLNRDEPAMRDQLTFDCRLVIVFIIFFPLESFFWILFTIRWIKVGHQTYKHKHKN